MLKKRRKMNWIVLIWKFFLRIIEGTWCSVSKDQMESCPFMIVRDYVQTSKVQHINMYLTLIYVFFWRTQRFDILWQFWFIIPLLRFKVYLWAIACFLMQQTNPHNQTPSLDLLVLFCENEFNPPINSTLLLKKSLAFFLNCFKTHP